MLSRLLVLLATAPGCVLAVGNADEGWVGSEYVVRLSWNAEACPETLVPILTHRVAVLEDALVIDGRVVDAQISGADYGVDIRGVRLNERWQDEGRSVPVVLVLDGHADDAMTLSGSLSSSAFADCTSDVVLSGPLILEE